MSMEYVRKHYGVPAKRGMRVRIYHQYLHGEWKLTYSGRITSASHYIRVDGIPFHPTWGVVYLNKNNTILKDCRRGAHRD